MIKTLVLLILSSTVILSFKIDTKKYHLPNIPRHLLQYTRKQIPQLFDPLDHYSLIYTQLSPINTPYTNQNHLLIQKIWRERLIIMEVQAEYIACRDDCPVHGLIFVKEGKNLYTIRSVEDWNNMIRQTGIRIHQRNILAYSILAYNLTHLDNSVFSTPYQGDSSTAKIQKQEKGFKVSFTAKNTGGSWYTQSRYTNEQTITMQVNKQGIISGFRKKHQP